MLLRNLCVTQLFFVIFHRKLISRIINSACRLFKFMHFYVYLIYKLNYTIKIHCSARVHDRKIRRN